MGAQATMSVRFDRPKTTSKGVNPILRPSTNAGRPITGVVRPQSSFKSGSMEQAVRTARTAKTARAVSSTSARNMRLGTASMASGGDGEFVNLARLNIDKYAADPQVNRQLFEYVFYYVNDIRIAHQIAGVATKSAGYEDHFWKNQLAKCYLRLGMLQDATKQLISSLQQKQLIETFAFLAKAYNRVDQPMAALKTYSQGLEVFPEDVTMLTGMARVQEALGEYELSVDLYKKVLDAQSNNIEAIACVATTYYYGGKPEIALRYYRRILQMGVSSAELFMNIGLCCLAAQQFDFALSSIM
uniref:TPR_REGION domain-containing protein n=1 Tax=Caenorhabditis japonica TaxID=281687 RepID=A0A8R1EMS1_CAEJA